MKHLAIFASGNGSNAQRLIDSFKESNLAQVALVMSNKSDAYVLKRAEAAGIPWLAPGAAMMKDGPALCRTLDQYSIDFIVLAGYLLLVPAEVIQRFPHRIVNIHPALLPLYGGKGMYGDHVHRAVLADGQKESGITIHYVTERYDEGAILFQARCPVLPEDTVTSLAERIHVLEHRHYPQVVAELLK